MAKSNHMVLSDLRMSRMKISEREGRSCRDWSIQSRKLLRSLMVSISSLLSLSLSIVLSDPISHVAYEAQTSELTSLVASLEKEREKKDGQQAEDGRTIQKQQKTVERYLAKRQVLTARKDECNKNIRDLGVLPEEAFIEQSASSDKVGFPRHDSLLSFFRSSTFGEFSSCSRNSTRSIKL